MQSLSSFFNVSGPEVIKHFTCSTQLSMKFILLVNVKMPTIVGILTFMSRINVTSGQENFFIIKETKSATMNIFRNFFIFFLNHL